MQFFAVTLALAILLCSANGLLAEPLEGGVDPKRIAEISATLGAEPFSFGPKITDRAAWQKLAAQPAFATVISKAEKKITEPMLPMTEQVYSLYKTTGQRTKEYNNVRSNRHGRILTYVLAEGVENKGRFIKPLEDAIADICTEPTWIFNFHDTGALDDWHGKRTFIDLGSILPAHDMAIAMVVLGDRLSPKTRALITENCRRRILTPYRNAVEGTDNTKIGWITAHHNWNAVCHLGVVGTALGIAEDKSERAFFIASAEKFSGDYLAGFGSDGYCNEGMGYWNYGFSNYVGLCELVVQATGGKVDFYDLPGAKLAATYPARMEIQNGLAASYADCALNPKPDNRTAALLNRRYQLGLKQWEMEDLSTVWSLPQALMYSSPSSATAGSPAGKAAGYELRSYFDDGGVLTCRPAEGSDCVMGVSLKGGHNAETHNHNDVGTFVVAVGKELLILDPGSEVYNARTFGKDRYKSNLLNSFGHPVPFVAGQMQSTGREAQAKIIRTDFTDKTDTFVMDIASAYPVPELKKLVRSFAYDRTGKGSLTVTDEFEFSSAQSFGGAMITYGQWSKKGDHAITITQGGESAEVTIDTGGAAFEIVSETINEQTRTGDKPTRIGINLKQPSAGGKIVLTIRPVVK